MSRTSFLELDNAHRQIHQGTRSRTHAPVNNVPIRRARFIVAVRGGLSRWPSPVSFAHLLAERTGGTWEVCTRGRDKSGPTHSYVFYGPGVLLLLPRSIFSCALPH